MCAARFGAIDKTVSARRGVMSMVLSTVVDPLLQIMRNAFVSAAPALSEFSMSSGRPLGLEFAPVIADRCSNERQSANTIALP